MDIPTRQAEALRFLSLISDGTERWCFQTFDDDNERMKAYKAAHDGYPDPALTGVLFGTLMECWDELIARNQRGAGIFVTINETDGSGKRLRENIVRVTALFIDLDGSPLEPALEWEYPPQLVINTSPGKWHCYWNIDFIAMDEFTAIQKALIEEFNSDPSIHDLPRVMRVPGFFHMKDPGNPFMVEINREACNECVAYDGEIFRQALLAPQSAEMDIEVEGEGLKPGSDPNDIDGMALKNLEAWVPKLFGQKARPYQKGYRIDSRQLGRPNEEALSIQPHGIVDFGVHDLGDEKKGKRLPSDLVMEYGGAPDKYSAIVWLCSCMGIDPPAKKAVVILKQGKMLDEALTASDKALQAAGIPIFERSDVLVRPVISETEAAYNRKTKVAKFTPVTPTWLRLTLAKHCQFKRYDAKKKLLDCEPPKEMVDGMLDRAGEFPYPVVTGILTTPTLRPDGSLLTEQGFDPATGLLLVATPEMPDIPARPTIDQARAALGRLMVPLNEFPFVNDVAKAVALSGILTPVTRGLFPLAPMHAARAPTAGTGKSYMWDLAAMVATGRPMPVMSAGKNEEETEKRLGSALIAGNSMVSIDNVNGVMGGDLLNQAMTQNLLDIRVLGKSQLYRVEARGITFYCTGNNIAFRGDFNRRVITANLNSNVERPELRDFVGDPLKLISENRGRFVADCLTIVRAWLTSGENPVKPLGSFREWSDAVRSALLWLGCADPVASIEVAREEDPELISRRDVFLELAAVFGVGRQYRKTVKDIARIANESDPMSRDLRWPDLFHAIRSARYGRGEGIDQRVFGTWMRDNKDKLVDGLQIKSEKNASLKTSEWWVESVDGTSRPGSYTQYTPRFGVVRGGRDDGGSGSEGGEAPF